MLGRMRGSKKEQAEQKGTSKAKKEQVQKGKRPYSDVQDAREMIAEMNAN